MVFIIWSWFAGGNYCSPVSISEYYAAETNILISFLSDLVISISNNI